MSNTQKGKHHAEESRGKMGEVQTKRRISAKHIAVLKKVL
jgi:hypothetical protein